MKEVWSTVVQEERYLPGDKWMPPSVVPARYELIVVTDDVIIHKESTLKRGVSKSGKTWARFGDEIRRVYSWRSGRLRQYMGLSGVAKGRGGHPIRETTQEGISIAINFRPANPSRVLEAFALRGLEPSDPERPLNFAADIQEREYPMSQFFKMGAGITPHMHHPTIQEFTASFFGAPRYRKDLVRAVGRLTQHSVRGEKNEALLLAQALAPLVPTDWLVRLLQSVPDNGLNIPPHRYNQVGGGGANLRVLRRALRTASPQQLRRMSYAMPDRANSYTELRGLADIVRGFERMRANDPDFRLDSLGVVDLGEIHDALATTANRIETKNFEIKYKGKAKSLPGAYGDIEIIAPADTHELVQWSNIMGNCISGYASGAAAGNVLLYAALMNGKMIANMELDKSGNVRQLLGPHNAHLEKGDAFTIKNAIHQNWPDAKTDGGWQ